MLSNNKPLNQAGRMTGGERPSAQACVAPLGRLPRMIVSSRWKYAILGLVLFAGLAAAQDSEPPSTPEDLASHFKVALKDALREGLAQGPVAGIAACQLRAPAIADRLSRDGVRMGRTSHRLRNPSNVPPDWVSPILEAYLANPTDLKARTVALPNDHLGYVEPLITQPVCLTCHGRVLAPEIAARVAELYPEDEAIGFEVGDLRGVLWITLLLVTDDGS
jgi:hypothetical protein